MRLSTDALEGRLEDFLINLRDMIARDNRTSTRFFDALKVQKITEEVCPPNVQDRNTFKELSLCGNGPTDWILGYKHRHLSKIFYNLFDACDGPSVGNDVLVELLSLV